MARQIAKGSNSAPNVLISDNNALGIFLQENFIVRLPAFRDAAAYAGARRLAARSARSQGDPMGHRYSETIMADGVTIESVWQELDPSKALELPPELTGTKAHTMFTLLAPARHAQIIVNGQALLGAVGRRVQAGFETTNAFLYFSVTWVLPPGST